jgi:DNA ligase-1
MKNLSPRQLSFLIYVADNHKDVVERDRKGSMSSREQRLARRLENLGLLDKIDDGWVLTSEGIEFLKSHTRGASKYMKTCDHCGKSCSRRVPAMLDGNIAMVGVGCAKNLKRPSRSDLSNSYGSDSSGVLLANKYANQDPIGWWISEKLDGVRAVWDGKNLVSRYGNKFHTPQWFKDELPKDVKLDGELFVGRGQFPETISIVKSHEDKGWSKIKYRVFDLPSDKRKFEDRQKSLRSIVAKARSRYLKYVKQTKCKSLAQFNKTIKDLTKLGAEGAMLRQPGSIYEPRRSSTLLKVKKFHDAEAKVVGHEKGTGRLSGLMGALICERNGKRFNVGSGFTDAQRRKPPKIGSKITFRYQEMTERGVPRFPTFVAVRDYE